jgi:hypothetical protein
VYRTARSKDGHCPPPATEEGEEARFVFSRQAEEGWTSTPYKPLNLSIGDLHRLDLETQRTSRRLDPEPERLTTVLYKTLWRRRDLYRPRRKTACAGERLERFP